MKSEKVVNDDIYRRLGFQESEHLETSYMGYAVKRDG